MADATFAQHAVWFTEQAGVAGTAYHMALGIRFGAGADRRALEDACVAVIARHEVLSIRVVDDGGTLRLAPATMAAAVEHGELTNEAVAAALSRGWDLRNGPLSRFLLLHGSTGEAMLLVTAHHIAFDGMSKDVLVRDLARAYADVVNGRPDDLGPPLTWAGLAEAERDRVAAELPQAKEHLSSWSAGELVLPGLGQRPKAAEPGTAYEIELPTDLLDAIDKARSPLGASRFEFLLTAVHLLLRRYGNVDPQVGVTLSTRTAATADHIGLLVNELPIGVRLLDDIAGSVAAVKTGLRKVYGFRAVPLSHVVSGLRPATALTPISFGYRRRSDAPAFAGVESKVDWAIFSGAARNVLHIQAVDHPTGLTLSLQYPPSALSADTIARIATHLLTLLGELAADPSAPVAGLSVMPADELTAVVTGCNDTARAYPVDSTVLSLFAARLVQTPDSVAVVDGDHTLTYAELDAASRRYTAALRDRGVGPGARVAVVLDRSWQAIAVFLAVLRCGAAYVPVDPGHPEARQALILTDANPVLAVAMTETRLSQHLRVLDINDVAAGEALDIPAVEPAPGDAAYVLYTSGSTGRPKGVVVPHDALANLLLGMAEVLDSKPGDRWLQLTSLGFDISGLEIFLPLTTGGRVVVAGGQSALDGAGILRLIRQSGVTHVQATPSGWRIILEAGLTPSPLVALAGGEALPVSLAHELKSRLARVFNAYGPTEATIWATMAEIPAAPQEVTIGTPIPNTRAYVLDEAMRPVPIGVPGELYLGGHGLATGYLGQPELTADRFVAAVGALSETETRLYRTGDRCRRLPDMRLEFLGRLDDQVKIRGHRVELGEITARLREHPGVGDAAVVLTGDDRLVGYVVPRGEARPEPADLRRHLAVTLPAAMLPADWVTLDRLPVGPNRKLDRAALPAPALRVGVAEVSKPDGLMTDTDPTVAKLTAIWEDVLQITDIGPHEDLFDLGGHSLTITRISSRIQRQLGVEVPMDTFFDMPTIAEIAEVVRQSGGGR